MRSRLSLLLAGSALAIGGGVAGGVVDADCGCDPGDAPFSNRTLRVAARL